MNLVESVHECFDLSYRESAIDHSLRKLCTSALVGETKQSSCVTCREISVFEKLKCFVGKLEQTKCVCNCGTALSDLLCYLLLRESEFVDERAVSHCFFYGIEILSLNVLDERHLSSLELVTVEYYRGDLCKSCHFCGSPTTFTCDYFVSSVAKGAFANDYRLKNTVSCNRIRKSLERFAVKRLSRLIAPGLYVGKSDSFARALGFERIIVKY